MDIWHPGRPIVRLHGGGVGRLRYALPALPRRIARRPLSDGSGPAANGSAACVLCRMRPSYVRPDFYFLLPTDCFRLTAIDFLLSTEYRLPHTVHCYFPPRAPPTRPSAPPSYLAMSSSLPATPPAAASLRPQSDRRACGPPRRDGPLHLQSPPRVHRLVPHRHRWRHLWPCPVPRRLAGASTSPATSEASLFTPCLFTGCRRPPL